MAAVCNFVIPALLYFTKSEVGNLVASGFAMALVAIIGCSL